MISTTTSNVWNNDNFYSYVSKYTEKVCLCKKLNTVSKPFSGYLCTKLHRVHCKLFL